jgi:hypothetical protein
MAGVRRGERGRRTGTGRIPESLLMWLLGEISDDVAFEAEPEPSSIISPVGVDGTWDGFDTFMLMGSFEPLFAENPGLREELGSIFAGMGRKPLWESRPKLLR